MAGDEDFTLESGSVHMNARLLGLLAMTYYPCVHWRWSCGT